jgi:shikimate dehydrogenase
MSGFLADLDAHGVTPARDTRVLLLGAGGAARAIGAGLAQRGVHIIIVNRTPEHSAALATALAEQFRSARVESLPSEQLATAAEGATLIVNTTPLGMIPNVESSPWDTRVPFPARAVVYDTVYRPQHTRLMRDAERAGLRAMGGIGMLVRQGAAAFEIWTQRAAPVEVMMQACLQQLRDD